MKHAAWFVRVKIRRHKNSKRILKIKLPLLLCLLPALNAHADEAFTFSSGVDYSTGKYGAADKTETLSIPLSAKYEFSDWTLRATIPYIESTGPSSVSGSGADRITLNNGQGSRHKATGFGDFVVAASNSVLASGPWLIDVGAKVKFATADKNEGLGTGENDYSIQTEIYRTLDRHTVFGTLGYKKMGDPEGLNLKNPWFTSAGWSFRAAQPTAVGLSYDYRQKITENGAPLREVTGFVTHKLDQHWKIQAYAVTGFSKASPDLGAGIFVFYLH